MLLDTDIVPDKMKLAKVIPIYKAFDYFYWIITVFFFLNHIY